MDQLGAGAGEPYADQVFVDAMDFGHFAIAHLVEREQEERSVKGRELADSRVELFELLLAIGVMGRGGRLHRRLIHQALVVAALATPGDGSVVRDAVEKSGRLRVAAKGRDGFPNGEEDFLHQVGAIAGIGKGVDDVVEDSAVLGSPLMEELLLIGLIHGSPS